MVNTIKVNGSTISYTTKAVTENVVTFSDGTELTIIGSVANAVVLKAYLASKVTAPTPPVNIPPVVILPPASAVREMSLQEINATKQLQGVNIKLKAGTYTDQMYIQDFNQVNIDLSAAQFSVKNAPAIQMLGWCNDLKLSSGNFKNGSGAVMYKFTPFYDGTPQTMVKNIVLENFVLEGMSSLFNNDGGLTSGLPIGKGFHGVNQGFKILNFLIKNCPDMANAVYLLAAEDFEISGGIVNNINASADNHNGVFIMGGNGKFNNNKVMNHEGSAFRAQPMQIIGSGKVLNADGNFVYNSRRYGAFEVQAMPDYINDQNFKPADSYITNNIAGKMSTTKFWEGLLLDTYSTKAKIYVANNAGFELYNNGQKVTKLVNENQGTETQVIETGSKIYDTQAQAVASNSISAFSSLLV